MASGTQDDCNRGGGVDYAERRAWGRAKRRKMKKSADFESDDNDSQDEEEDQTSPVKVGKNLEKGRVKAKSSEMSKGVKAGKKQSSNPKNVNDPSYIRRLLALLQAQGKM